MESINVLVNIPIDKEFLEQITAISPRIKIDDISNLVSAERRGDFSHTEEMDAALAKAEVMYGFGLPQDVISRAPRLKWVQVVSAGVDRFLDDKVRESALILTNSSGVMATPISEFVLQLMLMFVKQAPTCFQLKREKQWKRLSTTVLSSKTVGIVGLGHIGREVARLAKAFGMRVIATRRSANRITSAGSHASRCTHSFLVSRYKPSPTKAAIIRTFLLASACLASCSSINLSSSDSS